MSIIRIRCVECWIIASKPRCAAASVGKSQDLLLMKTSSWIQSESKASELFNRAVSIKIRHPNGELSEWSADMKHARVSVRVQKQFMWQDHRMVYADQKSISTATNERSLKMELPNLFLSQYMQSGYSVHLLTRVSALRLILLLLLLLLFETSSGASVYPSIIPNIMWIPLNGPDNPRDHKSVDVRVRSHSSVECVKIDAYDRSGWSSRPEPLSGGLDWNCVMGGCDVGLGQQNTIYKIFIITNVSCIAWKQEEKNNSNVWAPQQDANRPTTQLDRSFLVL